jgi:hypothetical protein
LPSKKLDETVMWLSLIIESELDASVTPKRLCREAGELLAILSKSHRTARDNLLE